VYPVTARECVIDATSSKFKCTSKKRAKGEDCVPPSLYRLPNEPPNCEPGLSCENTDDGATWKYTCTDAVTTVGGDCDTDRLTDDELTCGTALTCSASKCVSQVDPGEDCESTVTPGTGDSALCKNNSYTEHWDGNGSFICSDAAIPSSNGGDALTCGG